MDFETVTAVAKAAYIFLKIAFFLSPRLYYFLKRKKLCLTESHLDDILCTEYERVTAYLRSFQVESAVLKSPDQEAILKEIKGTIRKKKDIFLFSTDEIAVKLFEIFLPKNRKRINEFLRYFYCYENGYKDAVQLTNFAEKLRSMFRRPYTIFHYLTIPSYRKQSYTDLLRQVDSIREVSPMLSEKFILRDVADFQKELPTVTNAIELALKNGSIKESTILNLTANEKIIFVQKYAEGLGDVYDIQKAEQERLDSIITKGKTQKARAEAMKAKEKLFKSWVRVPLGQALERNGFVQLFKEMDGVYFLPLSLVPREYSENVSSYMNDVIVKDAKRYLNDCKRNRDVLPAVRKSLKTLPDSLNYILLFQVFPISQFTVLVSNRTLSFSAPRLSSRIFTNFLIKDRNDIATLYIADLLQNIDIESLLDDASKAGGFLLKNIGRLKALLWTRYNVDLTRPIQLLALSEIQLNEVATLLVGRSKETKVTFVIKVLRNKLQFYRQIQDELSKYKAGSRNKRAYSKVKAA